MNISGFAKYFIILAVSLMVTIGCETEQEKEKQSVEMKNEIPESHQLISLQEPRSGDKVDTLLNIKGEARGYWYFEGDFPIELRNREGRTVYQSYISAQSEWMTEDFVPFEKTLIIPDTLSGLYKLFLLRSNPSGLEEKVDSLIIPIQING